MAGHSFASPAALSALLRYAPQREGLKELRRAAEERYAAQVQAGRSEGTLGVQAANAAVKPTSEAFDRAATEGARGRALIAPALAQVGPGNPLGIAAQNEAAAGTERLATERAHALADVQQRKIAATELPAFMRESAVTTLAKELLSLSQKQSSLQGQEGADVQAEVERQRQEANKDRLTERGQNITRKNAQEGVQQRREAAEGKKNGKPTVTHHEQEAAASTIAEIRHYAGAAPEHLSRAEKVAILTAGEPGTHTDTKTGEHSSQSTASPGIPAFKPDVTMSAALDWAEYGHLTAATQHRLERAGYDVGQLGVPTQGQYEKQHAHEIAASERAGAGHRRA